MLPSPEAYTVKVFCVELKTPQFYLEVFLSKAISAWMSALTVWVQVHFTNKILGYEYITSGLVVKCNYTVVKNLRRVS